jgi:hypothetical protein
MYLSESFIKTNMAALQGIYRKEDANPTSTAGRQHAVTVGCA